MQADRIADFSAGNDRGKVSMTDSLNQAQPVRAARTSLVLALWSFLLLSACGPDAPVSDQAPATPQGATAPQSTPDFSSLVGRWVRPDGGYVIAIRSVNADGKLDASYANPNPLPFSRAEATRDGDEIKVYFELTAGGYAGSNYTLTFDAAKDILRGVYYQAVAKQRYDVYFERDP